MKKVLIIGANASIAKNLIDLLSQSHEYEIHALQRVKSVNTDKVFYHQTDYSNIENYKSLIKSAEYIFYTIGITNGSETEIKEINIDLFNKFLSYFSHESKIIYMSSASPLYNDNAYAKSKLYAEKKLKELNFSFIALRPSVMYGPYDRNNLVKIINFIKKLPIVPVIAPSYKIQPVYMPDIAKLILKAIQHNIFTNKEYIISGPKQISMYELFRLLKQKLKLKRPLIPIPLKPVQLVIKFLNLFIPAKYLLAYQVLNMKIHQPFDSSLAIEDFDFEQTPFEIGILKD